MVCQLYSLPFGCDAGHPGIQRALLELYPEVSALKQALDYYAEPGQLEAMHLFLDALDVSDATREQVRRQFIISRINAVTGHA